MRKEKEIAEAELEFHEKLWYGRHRSLENEPAKSKADREIQKEADKAAAELEEKYGIEELGPYNDFGWGMLSGKLSALRWVLGEDWDSLDT
jgi:hypothetical protein